MLKEIKREGPGALLKLTTYNAKSALVPALGVISYSITVCIVAFYRY